MIRVLCLIASPRCCNELIYCSFCCISLNAIAREEASCALTGCLLVLTAIRQHAVDPDCLDAVRGLHRIGKRRRIANRRRIEQHQISPIAFLDQTTIAQAEPRGRQTRHLAHRHGERKQLLFAAVITQHAWKGTPQSWMRQRIVRETVRTNHRRWMAQDTVDVVVRHAVVHGACRHQATRGFGHVDIPFFGDLGQQLAALLRMRLRPGHLNVVSISHLLQIQCGRAGGVGIAIATDMLMLFCLFERPQFSTPAHLRCEITTGTRACLPMRKASSMASRMSANSLRRCVAYMAPYSASGSASASTSSVGALIALP